MLGAALQSTRFYAATHRVPPPLKDSDYKGWYWEGKQQYRHNHHPIGPGDRPITPEREFRDAFMEGFNKRY